MEEEKLALEILEKLDEVMQVNWNMKDVYIRKIVEVLKETSTTSGS